MRIHRRTQRRVPTAYAILGVAPGETLDRIHRHYKELAVSQHPDKGGDGEKFAQITMAWTTIKNYRTTYDAELRITGRLDCHTCEGRGLVYQSRLLSKRGGNTKVCSVCGGTGECPAK